MGALLFAFLVSMIITLGYVDALTSQSIAGTQSSVNVLLGFQFITWIDIFGPINIPWINDDWIAALWDAVTWNFWFFSGIGEHIRTLIALVVTSLAGWAFVVNILPILLSAASTALQGVRATLGGISRLIRGTG